MARIRTIKPEFFTSEDIVSLTPLARVFYVALWCEADREGRLEWKPRTLKMRYLPADNCDIEALGQELIDLGLVVLYVANGKQYAHIPGFKKHQVINNRESESVIPEPASSRVDDASMTRESGKEGKGREGKEHASSHDGDSRSLAPADAGQDPKPNGTPIGALCKRIRQESGFTGVAPHDPKLIGLLDAGYTDEEIIGTCRDAMQSTPPKGWGWVVATVQGRRSDAAKIRAAQGEAPGPSDDRMAKFAGAL